ncbi:hypothetical protein NL676_030113 [Syzygium grande]|nr:hypothetical protein NL676_030113 [Syzygium grande]
MMSDTMAGMTIVEVAAKVRLGGPRPPAAAAASTATPKAHSREKEHPDNQISRRLNRRYFPNQKSRKRESGREEGAQVVPGHDGVALTSVICVAVLAENPNHL